MSERILLVDDEIEFLDVMAERLRVRGMEVFTAESPEAAVSMIDKEILDVVILDYSMPGMDGIQTMKMLRGKKPDLKVILLTGYGTVGKGIEAMKMGAFDFLEKPADIDLLVTKIRQATENVSSGH